MTRHYRIVAAIDSSEAAVPVLEHTLDQAARHESSEIHLVAVTGSEYDVLALEAQLAELVVRSLTGGVTDVETHTHVRNGVPEEEIANLAAELEADLIVIGRHDVPARTSVSDRVLRAAICPTLVVGLDSTATPPCAVCVAVRAESRGACWYCARHERDSRTLVSRAL